MLLHLWGGIFCICRFKTKLGYVVIHKVCRVIFVGYLFLRNGVKITSQFDAILLPPSILSFSLNSPTIRLKR